MEVIWDDYSQIFPIYGKTKNVPVTTNQPCNALALSKALIQELTTELLHPVVTVVSKTSLPQPCKVPMRTAAKVIAIEKTLMAEDFIANQSVVDGANDLAVLN